MCARARVEAHRFYRGTHTSVEGVAKQRRTLHFAVPLSRHHLAGLKASPHQLVRASWLPSYGPAPTFLFFRLLVDDDRVSQFFYSPPADEPPENATTDYLTSCYTRVSRHFIQGVNIYSWNTFGDSVQDDS